MGGYQTVNFMLCMDVPREIGYRIKRGGKNKVRACFHIPSVNKDPVSVQKTFTSIRKVKKAVKKKIAKGVLDKSKDLAER